MGQELPQFGGPEFTEEQMKRMAQEAVGEVPAGEEKRELAVDLKKTPSIPLKPEDPEEKAARLRKLKEGIVASDEQVNLYEHQQKLAAELRDKYKKN